MNKHIAHFLQVPENDQEAYDKAIERWWDKLILMPPMTLEEFRADETEQVAIMLNNQQFIHDARWRDYEEEVMKSVKKK